MLTAQDIRDALDELDARTSIHADEEALVERVEAFFISKGIDPEGPGAVSVEYALATMASIKHTAGNHAELATALAATFVVAFALGLTVKETAADA